MTAKEERMVGVENLEWVRKHGEETPLRTALFWCRERLIDVVCGHGPELGDYEKCCREAVDMATAALAAPPRNCDVGTAEEQEESFKLFCDANPTCAGCPCGLHPAPSCGVAWAQLPCAEATQEGGDHADA